MKEYHFTIQYEDYSAKLVLGGEWSLADFAKFIIRTIDFDFDHAYQFCDNLRNPYHSKESYSVFADMGERTLPNGRVEGSVIKTRVSKVFTPKRKMLFHYDYGDDWCFLVTCDSIQESSANTKFSKVLSTEGNPPVQYPDWDEDDEGDWDEEE